MYPNLLLLFLAMISHHCIAHSRVPVFLISSQEAYKDTSLRTNPFHEVSSGYFSDILGDILEKSDTVIVFVEENLSPEDISTKDDRGTPYVNIQRRFKEAKATFLPAVHKPYRVLTQNLQLSASNYLNISKADSYSPEIYKRKFFYIFFIDDPEISRAEKLRRHDALIEQILTSVQNFGIRKVAAVYTGIRNPAKDITQDLPVIRSVAESPLALNVKSKNTMFRFTGLLVKTAMRQSLDYHSPLRAEEFSWGDELTTRVTSPDFVLEFHFLLGKETWVLDRVTMLEDGDEVGSTRMDVRVPWKRSFVCGNPLVVVNNRDGSAVVIPHYQLEPFQHSRHAQSVGKRKMQDEDEVDSADETLSHSATSPRYRFTKTPASQWTSSLMYLVDESPNTTSTSTAQSTVEEHAERRDDNEPPKQNGGKGPQSDSSSADESEEIQKFFSEAVVCCPFFTPAILTVFFVLFWLVGILFVGLYVLMSCKTHDKYDSPHMASMFDLPANK